MHTKALHFSEHFVNSSGKRNVFMQCARPRARFTPRPIGGGAEHAIVQSIPNQTAQSLARREYRSNRPALKRTRTVRFGGENDVF